MAGRENGRSVPWLPLRSPGREFHPIEVPAHGTAPPPTRPAYFTFSYSAAHDENGAITGMFCVCQETTGRLAAERSLEEREDTLADAVIVREALLDEKDMLLAEVNHRFKNSLQLVVSALSLESRRLADPVT